MQSYTNGRVKAKDEKRKARLYKTPMSVEEIVTPAKPAFATIAKMIECGEVTGGDYVALQGTLAVYSHVLKLAGKELFDTTFAIRMINRCLLGVPVSKADLNKLMQNMVDLVERCKRVRERRVWSVAQQDCEVAAFLADYKWENIQEYIAEQSKPFVD